MSQLSSVSQMVVFVMDPPPAALCLAVIGQSSSVTASEFIFKLERKFLVSLPCCKTGEQTGSVCCVFNCTYLTVIEQVDHHLCRINLTAV